MHSRSSVAAALLFAALLPCAACAGNAHHAKPVDPPPLPSPSASEETASDASADATDETPSPVARDAQMDALLAERDRVFDWRATVYGLRADNPPIRVRTSKLPARGVFPTAEVASIHAYLLQGTVGKDAPFTSDGRLMPNVVTPEVDLSAEEKNAILVTIGEAKRLMKVGKDGYRTRTVMRCDFDPHHVLVFFDAKGAPVGKLDVCMSCGQWYSVPQYAGLGADGEASMPPATAQVIAQVLDAHHLGAWVYRDDAKMETLRGYETRIYGTRGQWTEAGRARDAAQRSLPSGVEPTINAASASKDDRNRLGTWFFNELKARGQPSYGEHGFECENGQTYTVDAAFPDRPIKCDAPMGKIEGCLRSFLEGPSHICTMGPGPSCEGILQCLPPVHWKTKP